MRLTRPLRAAVLAAAALALAASPAHAGGPSLADLVGEKLVVAMSGTRPSHALLRRVRNGRVGGVILFSENVRSARQVRRLTVRLRRAARAGGRPRPIVTVDQEGGPVKRLPFAPPDASPPEMGRSRTLARGQGLLTGRALRRLGIDVDLAPVADVPRSPLSFLLQQGRAFGTGARRVARTTTAFLTGLERGGAIGSMKHFPGLGFATTNTDETLTVIRESRRRLAPELRPYRRALAHGRLHLVMLANARYPAYDPDRAAGWSRRIGVGLLRKRLGFRGVTITDSLDGAAASRGLAVERLAVLAARARTDLLLSTGSEAASRSVHAALLRAARRGDIDRADLLASHARIESLRSRLAALRRRPAPASR